MLGVFTINVPGFAGHAASRQGTGYSDSLIKGILATLLATPCSGPFLGGVLAWAFMQPVHVIFIIFTSVGLGMALPYILIALVPAMARFIPKPGDWLNIMEVIMGFLLIFTSVYLISFLNHDNVVSTLLLMVFVSAGLWQYGRYGSMDKKIRSRRISKAALILSVLCGAFISFYIFSPAESRAESRAFSPDALLESRDAGKVSVVNFTADWCPNCKLVEKTVLESKGIQELLSGENILFFTADITRGNPEAEELMSRLGSGSIPFLAVFPPGEGFTKPVCLRDIYSAADLKKAIRMSENN